MDNRTPSYDHPTIGSGIKYTHTRALEQAMWKHKIDYVTRGIFHQAVCVFTIFVPYFLSPSGMFAHSTPLLALLRHHHSYTLENAMGKIYTGRLWRCLHGSLRCGIARICEFVVCSTLFADGIQFIAPESINDFSERNMLAARLRRTVPDTNAHCSGDW